MNFNPNAFSVCATITALLAVSATPSDARVTRFEVSTTQPAYDGQAFGEAGPYERIEGVAHFAIDPASDRAARIVDIDKAPVNEDGEVAFSAEVVILRPTGEGSGTLFYEIPNRGRNLSFPLLNLSGGSDVFTAEDPGDGFMMAEGHTLVWGGWQPGLDEALLSIDLPMLEGVTGPSREEFIFDDTKGVSTGTLSYPAADMDPGRATLTVRPTPDAPRETPEGLSFRYIDERTIEITRPEGQNAGAIYEFVYPATEAIPAGLAFVATSDLVSFLRGNPGHDAEAPVTGIERTIGMGISQSGRFLRDLVYQGFNADEGGDRVFDGAMPHIAGSRKTFTNYRFAQPGRYSRQHEDHDFPGDQFPFTYVEATDPLTGETDSILDACQASWTCPMVMHSDTSTEFWQARASLVSTTVEGEPLEMPDEVRLYFLAGAPHFNGWGGTPGESEVCVYPSNPVSAAPTMRALVVAMEAWLRDGTEPPESVYPGLEPETLVDPDALELPRIDGTVPQPVPNILRVLDHSATPPNAGEAYSVRVPPVDADGIPQGGVREPYIAAPLGTYLGWNLRAEGYGAGDLCSLTGSFIEFPSGQNEDDGRRPVSSRYNGPEGYREAVRSAAEDLAQRRLMRAEDVEFVVGEAPEFPRGAE